MPSSCSLLHSPIDLSVDTRLDAEVKSWFAVALHTCHDLALLRDALNSGDTAALAEWSAPIQARRHSTRVHNPAVEKRLAAITAQDRQRANVYEVRAEAQRARVKLPAWPTTTIGSFPQTTEIRTLRLDFKMGNLDANNYRTGIAEHIKQAIVEQERLGLDVLVHGEAERNDMVEYFGALLHSPIDLSVDTRLDADVKSWFAFALHKCHDLALLRDALNSGDTAALAEWSAQIQARRHYTRVHNPAVEKRLAAITAQDSQRANV